jgi:hypothetical protein
MSPFLPFMGSEPVRTLEQHWDEWMSVMPLGGRDVGSNQSKVRFLANRHTEYIEVHVQHDGAGGGGTDYDPNVYVSKTLVDCRADRLREVTVNRDGTNHYYVWLIPVILE